MISFNIFPVNTLTELNRALHEAIIDPGIGERSAGGSLLGVTFGFPRCGFVGMFIALCNSFEMGGIGGRWCPQVDF